MSAIFANTLHLALESAPWLLFGLIAAGLIRAWLPLDWVGRALGGSGPGAVIRAALVGAPLPLCSCGTLPAAFSLRRNGASKASTTAFLIATPETGVDSVALSWVLLGPFLAILRPLAAILSAISAGLLVGHAERNAPKPVAPDIPPISIPIAPESSGSTASCDSACCDCSAATQEASPGPFSRTGAGLKYAFTDLMDDLAPWLALGILAAGLVVTFVPPQALANWGSGLIAMLLIVLVSVPMYVCATASTPLAHAMLYSGVSPGTVLVFLLAGPASNLSSLVLVRRELGVRTLWAYLIGVCGTAVLLGLLLDWLILSTGLNALAGMAATSAEGEATISPLAALSLLALCITAIPPLRRFMIRGKGDANGGCCG